MYLVCLQDIEKLKMGVSHGSCATNETLISKEIAGWGLFFGDQILAELVVITCNLMVLSVGCTLASTQKAILLIISGGMTMFGMFKKQIHEPAERQLADLAQYPTEFRSLVVDGLPCDTLPGAHGPFGSLSNPIPVNGALGEIKYLGKLRGESGFALFFHRICSTSSPVCQHSIDVYETVCMDGTQWATLHFDMYHPRRSNLAPAGFTLVPFDRRLKMDLPFAYGVNELVSDFPHGLPGAIVRLYGEHPGNTFARHAQEKLDHYTFRRPPGGE